jgi:hypothetical protein
VVVLFEVVGYVVDELSNLRSSGTPGRSFRTTIERVKDSRPITYSTHGGSAYQTTRKNIENSVCKVNYEED